MSREWDFCVGCGEDVLIYNSLEDVNPVMLSKGPLCCDCVKEVRS